MTNRDVLKVSMFNKDMLHVLFDHAETFRKCVHNERNLDHILQGKVGFSESASTNVAHDGLFSAGDGVDVLRSEHSNFLQFRRRHA